MRRMLGVPHPPSRRLSAIAFATKQIATFSITFVRIAVYRAPLARMSDAECPGTHFRSDGKQSDVLFLGEAEHQSAPRLNEVGSAVPMNALSAVWRQIHSQCPGRSIICHPFDAPRDNCQWIRIKQPNSQAASMLISGSAVHKINQPSLNPSQHSNPPGKHQLF